MLRHNGIKKAEW